MAENVIEIEARLRDYISANLEKLEGNLKQFSQKSNTAMKSTETVSRDLKSAVSALPGPFGALAGAAGPLTIAIGAATAAAISFKKSIDFASNIADMSARLGVSSEEFQRFSVIAKDAGVDAASLGVGMRTLAGHITNNSAVLRQFNVATVDSKGNLRDTGTVATEVATKLAGIKDSARQTTLAMELFGRGGLDILQIMRQNKDAFAETTEEMRKQGLLMTTEQVQALDRMGDAWDRLVTKTKVGIAQFWGDVADLISPDKAAEAQLKKQQQTLDRYVSMYNYAAETKAGQYILEDYKKKVDYYSGLVDALRKEVYGSFVGPKIPEKTLAFRTSAELKQAEDDAKKKAEIAKKAAEEQKAYEQSLYAAGGAGAFEQLDEYNKYVEDAVKAHGGYVKSYSDTTVAMQKAATLERQINEEKFTSYRDTYQQIEQYRREDIISEERATELKALLCEKQIDIEKRKKEMLRQNVIATFEAGGAMMRLAEMAVRSARMEANEKKKILRAMAIADAAGAAVKGIYSVWSGAGEPWYKIAMTAVVAADIIASAATQIQSINAAQFARGTRSAPGGMALVGERGPELMRLPMGSTIYNNYETRNMLGGNTSTNAPTTINLTIHDSSGGVGAVMHRQLRNRELEPFVADLRKRLAVAG